MLDKKAMDQLQRLRIPYQQERIRRRAGPEEDDFGVDDDDDDDNGHIS